MFSSVLAIAQEEVGNLPAGSFETIRLAQTTIQLLTRLASVFPGNGATAPFVWYSFEPGPRRHLDSVSRMRRFGVIAAGILYADQALEKPALRIRSTSNLSQHRQLLLIPAH